MARGLHLFFFLLHLKICLKVVSHVTINFRSETEAKAVPKSRYQWQKHTPRCTIMVTELDRPLEADH